MWAILVINLTVCDKIKIMKKITKKQETEIISLYKTGKYSMAFLGKKYSVSYTAINKLLKRNSIPSRKTWKDSKENVGVTFFL